ncbi:MAG: nitroreductase family protein [Pseudonocardiales bacterium]|nr:nitroreductase family protein [Pseudonocardiales bacterium]MBV9650619.1 nitroreductase family protein [Pseudonocardiales bacterium]
MQAGLEMEGSVETWDAVRSRRNVRQYAEQSIPPGALDRVLEAGRRSPSSRNWQPWDFVVVTDRDQLVELAKVWQGAQHVAKSAATVALVAPVTHEDRERDWVQYDLGQATMAMMITAADLGIGAGHAAVVDQDLARKLLGLPADRFCAYLVTFGYPADRPLTPIHRPDRRPFDDVVHRGRW